MENFEVVTKTMLEGVRNSGQDAAETLVWCLVNADACYREAVEKTNVAKATSDPKDQEAALLSLAISAKATELLGACIAECRSLYLVDAGVN